MTPARAKQGDGTSDSLVNTPSRAAALAEAGVAVDVDLWTVAVIAVVAYIATVFIHEAVGHGGAAILTGARIVQLTTVNLRYQGEGLTPCDHRIIAAAGCAANLMAGIIALCFSRSVLRASAVNGYFCWLFGHVNLFTAGGYPMTLSFVEFGDWNAFTRGLPHRTAWQAGMTLLGAAISFAALGHALRGLEPFLGCDGAARRRRALMLTLVPYLVGGTVNTVAGLFNPEGMYLVAFSAMASTFGGTAFLGWLPKFVGLPDPKTPGTPKTPTRSWAWITLAIIVLIADLSILAPGIPR